MARVSSLSSLIALTTVLGCVDLDAETTDTDALMSWEEFLAAASSEHEGQTIYRVEWDRAVTLEQLEQLYADYLEGEGEGEGFRGNVNVRGGVIDTWTPSEAISLTYCVSDDFGSYKARAVAEMAAAAAEWEAAANVNFIRVLGWDHMCDNTNPHVRFAVRPTTFGGACAFFPWGGGCIARTVLMDFDDFDNNPEWDIDAPNMTTTGVFRHELGHVLGFRHEHVRPESNASGVGCSEGSWTAATPYDVDSVMHYQWCNGDPNSDMTLSEADERTAEMLYGRPGGKIVPQVGNRVRLRHGSTGKCAYAQGGDGYGVLNWECWGDPLMVFVLDDAGNGQVRLRHEASNQCLYVNPGGQVRHWTCWGDPAMRFELESHLGGYRLRNVEDNMSLVGDANDGGQVHAALDDVAVPQQIYLVDVLGPSTGSWTGWFDRDDPSGTGDYELASNLDPGEVCANPSLALCETTDGRSHWWTGENTSCSANGLVCVANNQPDGSCEDYRVKFYCP